MIISFHALASISSPQMPKIKGFIKHRSMAVLIDNGNTYNFSHKWVVEDVHFFHIGDIYFLCSYSRWGDHKMQRTLCEHKAPDGGLSP